MPTPYRDGPPLAHTGGFGEPTCSACHGGRDVNTGSGTVGIDGFPSSYRTDSTYTIVVSIVQADMVLSGFELAIRDSLGNGLGTLGTMNPAVVVSTSEAGVEYAHHSRQGSTHAYPDSARWSLRWTAPGYAAGPAVLNLALNAANGDNSEFGDDIYVSEQVTHPAHD